MPFVPALNTAFCRTVYLWDNQEVENTLWFRNTGGAFDEISIANLAISIENNLIANLIPNQSNDVTYLFTEAVDQTAPNGFVGIASGNPTIGGTATPTQANNVSLAVGFRTGVSGRSFHGRNFLIGLPGTAISQSEIDPTYLLSVSTGYNNFRSAVAADGFVHVVASRFTGFTIVDGKKVPTPRATAVITPITSYVFSDNIVDAQRRRLPGRGK